MAFMKYARAQVMHPRITGAAWQGIRKQASSAPTASKNLVAQAGEILGEQFTPDRYLLTHCFPAGHAVLMADGTEKPIEQVQVGDLVVTHKGNVKPVTRLLRKEVDEHLTVLQAASLPEVVVTGEHPFYVIREKNAWCKVFPSYQGQVKCTYGGKQVCESNTCLTNGAVPEWVDANAVQVGDRTYTPTLHETQVAGDLNPNRMRVLGYYVAEGHVSKDNAGREHGVHFSLHQDEIPTLGAEIARLMRLEFGVSTHAVAAHEGSKGVMLSFYTHTHAPWFLQHAGKGSRNKRLSSSVMWAPHEWQKQLIGAWLNGDGHYGGTNQGGSKGIRLATSSNDLASQAVVLLDRVGVHSRLQRVIQETGREYRGRYIKGFDGWHVEVSVSYLMKLADVVRWPVTGNAHKNLSTKGRYRYAASTLSTVEQVGTRPYKGTVYNFSVQDDESYVVNRMAVHNCSIVASVDVDNVPNVKLGTEKVGSRTVTRKWADYYIKPECAQFVNNNGDSWSREVLLKSFRTFIGAHNFLEHVQIEEQSKGRIIDAVARDIGPSVYVDILVATDRKHAQLVQDIESGKMGTLSMGCSCEFTLCSQCGNVAVDETDLCEHVKYSKLNTFFDARGQRRVIAELCGHSSHGETGGVHFIEASWVAVPAFAGAVMRNILDPASVTPEKAKQFSEVLSAPPAEWGTNILRAASEHRVAQQFDFGDMGDDEGGEGEGEADAAAPEKPASPFAEIEDDLYNAVKTRVKDRLEKELREQNIEKALATPTAPNDSIIKEATAKFARQAYANTVNTLVRVASSDAALVNGLAEIDRSFGLRVPQSVYRTALMVGATDRYSSFDEYLRACHKQARRVLTPSELRVAYRIGNLLTRKGSVQPPQPRK
jgi:hypothetical protein